MASYFYIALALLATCHAGSVSKAAPGSSQNYVCKSKNAYYPIDSDCDSYIQCNDYSAVTATCPDGLHYNPETKWPEYPCGYPSDVSCSGRAPQKAQPSPDCPHQYGYFPSPDTTPDNCGNYKWCVEGVAVNMECAEGLAFNPASSRCDWPENVPSCKSNNLNGFVCPSAPVNEFGEALDTVTNYKYPGDCFYFYSCQFGRARLLSCDIGLAFDSASGYCVDEDFVKCEKPRAYA